MIRKIYIDTSRFTLGILSIKAAQSSLSKLRNYLVENKGMSKEEAKDATKHFYKTYRHAFEDGFKAAVEINNLNINETEISG